MRALVLIIFILFTIDLNSQGKKEKELYFNGEPVLVVLVPSDYIAGTNNTDSTLEFYSPDSSKSINIVLKRIHNNNDSIKAVIERLCPSSTSKYVIGISMNGIKCRYKSIIKTINGRDKLVTYVVSDIDDYYSEKKFLIVFIADFEGSYSLDTDLLMALWWLEKPS